mmetsp:Transcript_3237/g.6697  ORF Transcript_3237/g.6697 Transcript_3237/m.6697 type:complete len:234 (+) Transcript_3237:52-753(+)
MRLNQTVLEWSLERPLIHTGRHICRAEFAGHLCQEVWIMVCSFGFCGVAHRGAPEGGSLPLHAPTGLCGRNAPRSFALPSEEDALPKDTTPLHKPSRFLYRVVLPPSLLFLSSASKISLSPSKEASTLQSPSRSPPIRRECWRRRSAVQAQKESCQSPFAETISLLCSPRTKAGEGIASPQACPSTPSTRTPQGTGRRGDSPKPQTRGRMGLSAQERQRRRKTRKPKSRAVGL